MPHEDTPPHTGTPEPLREPLATQSAVQEWEGTLKRQLSAVLAAVNAAAAAQHAVAGRARLPAVVRDLSRALDAALEQAVAAGRGGGAGAGGEPGADAHETHGVAVLAPLPLGAGRRCTATDQAAGEAPPTRPHKMPRADDGEARVQDAAIETCALLGLLGPAVAGLPDADKVALAATSSAMLWAVLDSSSAARWTAVGRDLGTRVGTKLFERVSGGSLGGCGKPARGLVGWTQDVQPGRNDPCPHWWAGSDVELASSIARLSGFLELGGSFITPDMTGLRCIDVSACGIKPLAVANWLPPSVAPRIEELILCGLSSVPEGMSSLAVFDIEGCRYLDRVCLPASSGRALRKLKAADSSLRQLPEGMSALEELDVERCKWLNDGFLPASSAANVRVVKAEESSISRLPGGMGRLEVLDVNCCGNLARDDPLPQSSAMALVNLDALASNFSKLPEHMPALEVLDVSASDVTVVPAGAVSRLRELAANERILSGLPGSLPALEVVRFHSFEDVQAAYEDVQAAYEDVQAAPEHDDDHDDDDHDHDHDDAVRDEGSVVSMPRLRVFHLVNDKIDMTEDSRAAQWAKAMLSRMTGRPVDLAPTGAADDST